MRSALVFTTSSLAVLYSFTHLPTSYATAVPIATVAPKNLREYYTRYHSLDENYDFTSSEGWHSVNATDLDYKYDTSNVSHLGKRKTKSKAIHDTDSVDDIAGALPGMKGAKSLMHVLDEAWNALKGIGKKVDVKITWYTGHDLKNPSCWANTEWAPTDESFACALTLEGWGDRPKCFKFLELCNGPKKCVFVRVVDTCAGCAKGSKHVDLTKAAFKQMADPDKGVLNVQMRSATDPKDWYEDLWGPKH